MNKLVLVDGNNLIYRCFYATPLIRYPDKPASNAVLGFTNMLCNLLDVEKPTHLAVCFDSGQGWRYDRYPAYKAKRYESPLEIVGQFELVEELLELAGIAVYRQDGLEADDLISILSRQAKTDETVLVSSDKGLLQLLNSRVNIIYSSKAPKYSMLDFFREYTFMPEQMVDYIALAGDKSDNIPGVRFIGAMAAKRLVCEYVNLENIIDAGKAYRLEITKKQIESLLISISNAYLFRELATLAPEHEAVRYAEERAKLGVGYNAVQVGNFFERLGYNGLANRLTRLIAGIQQTQEKEHAGAIVIY